MFVILERENREAAINSAVGQTQASSGLTEALKTRLPRYQAVISLQQRLMHRLKTRLKLSKASTNP